jgi:hypothetical protein
MLDQGLSGAAGRFCTKLSTRTVGKAGLSFQIMTLGWVREVEPRKRSYLD